MLSIHVEAVNERNADLRRAADQARRRRALRAVHQGPPPGPPRQRARRTIRATAATVAGRITR